MSLILASGSPRRKELLKLITEQFAVHPVDADETLPEGMPVEMAAAYLADLKAHAAAQIFPEDIVIGCDTVVILGDADENPVVTERGGFRFTDEWLVRDHRMAVSYYQTYELYFANILGYRINLVDIRNVAPYLTLDEVRKMPVFPLPGSVRMVGDTLIVRLSEDIRPEELRNP